MGRIVAKSVWEEVRIESCRATTNWGGERELALLLSSSASAYNHAFQTREEAAYWGAGE